MLLYASECRVVTPGVLPWVPWCQGWWPSLTEGCEARLWPVQGVVWLWTSLLCPWEKGESRAHVPVPCAAAPGWMGAFGCVVEPCIHSFRLWAASQHWILGEVWLFCFHIQRFTVSSALVTSRPLKYCWSLAMALEKPLEASSLLCSGRAYVSLTRSTPALSLHMSLGFVLTKQRITGFKVAISRKMGQNQGQGQPSCKWLWLHQFQWGSASPGWIPSLCYDVRHICYNLSFSPERIFPYIHMCVHINKIRIGTINIKWHSISTQFRM